MKRIMALVLAILASLFVSPAPAQAQTITSPIPLGAVNGRVMWEVNSQYGYIMPIDYANIYLSRIDQNTGGRVLEGYAQTDGTGHFLIDQPNSNIPLNKYDFLVIMRSGFDDLWEEVSLRAGYNSRADSFVSRKRVDIGVNARIDGNRLKWSGYMYANVQINNPERWVLTTILGGTTFTSMSAQSPLASVKSVGMGYPYTSFEHSVELLPGPQGTWVWGQLTVTLPNAVVLADASSTAYFAVMRDRPSVPVFFMDGREFSKFQEAVRRGEDPTAVGRCVITITPGKAMASMSVAKPAKPTGPGFFTDPEMFNKMREMIRPQAR